MFSPEVDINRMFVEGASPATYILSRFPLQPILRLWMEHPSRGKVKTAVAARMKPARPRSQGFGVWDKMASCPTPQLKTDLGPVKATHGSSTFNRGLIAL